MWLQSLHAGHTRVRPHCCAADTEMEAEVEPSIETQARLAAAEQEERLRQVSTDALCGVGARSMPMTHRPCSKGGCLWPAGVPSHVAHGYQIR